MVIFTSLEMEAVVHSEGQRVGLCTSLNATWLCLILFAYLPLFVSLTRQDA